MQTVRFADGQELAINYIQDTGANYITISTPLETASGLDALAAMLTPAVVSKVELITDGETQRTYTDMVLVTAPTFRGVELTKPGYAEFCLRHKTDEERQQETMAALAVILTDEQAVLTPEIYPAWEDDPEGYHYSLDDPKDQRRTYGGGLWKLLQDHDKQESWYPGAAPTLWVQLDADQHAGTQEDPIPVPISVTASGFEYEAGKYYTWSGQTYLCQRDGMESGTKIILYYPPSDLVGHYFAAA